MQAFPASIIACLDPSAVYEKKSIDALRLSGSPTSLQQAAVTMSSSRVEISMEQEDDDVEEEVEEWTGDPKNRPIWKFPVVSRVRNSSRGLSLSSKRAHQKNCRPFSSYI